MKKIFSFIISFTILMSASVFAFSVSAEDPFNFTYTPQQAYEILKGASEGVSLNSIESLEGEIAARRDRLKADRNSYIEILKGENSGNSILQNFDQNDSKYGYVPIESLTSDMGIGFEEIANSQFAEDIRQNNIDLKIINQMYLDFQDDPNALLTTLEDYEKSINNPAQGDTNSNQNENTPVDQGPGLKLLGVDIGCSGADCDFDDLLKVAGAIVTFIIALSIPVAAALFIYAGFLYVTAGIGGSGQVTKAKDIFATTLKGFVIILAAWLIVYTIVTALVADSFLDPQTGFFRFLNLN